MSTILITGSKGFIGKNLLATLSTTSHILIPLDIDHTEEELISALEKADFIFHLAGVNRAISTEEYHQGNVSFTEHILLLLEKLNKRTPLLITSSIQATLDNPYGKSKHSMEELVQDWATKTQNKVFMYRLANVFGKWCKPNYNSVVATFCYNIARDLPITIHNKDHVLPLIYIDDVIASFLSTFENSEELSTGLYKVSPTHYLPLKELADKLYSFKAISTSLLIPNLENAFDRALYATYLSYVEPHSLSSELTSSEDQRGRLCEIIKSHQLGQFFVSTTKPGITRGNHFHHTKIEKFLVLQGHARIALRHLITGEIITYEVSDHSFQVIDIPPGYTHNITNIGTIDLITLFWSDEIFDPDLPDTYYKEV